MTRYSIFYLSGLTLLLLQFNSVAQKAKNHTITADEAKSIKKDAAYFFNAENYNAALPAFIDLVKSSPGDAEFNYRLGICYLKTNSLHEKAVEPLEIASQAKDAKKDTWYFLGMAYMAKNDFDKAIESFERCKSIQGFKVPKDNPTLQRWIEMCQNGKELTSRPISVSFTNLGASVNSIGDDYNPMISADEKQLVFSTRRKGNLGGYIEELGMYSADVYWSNWKDTAWIKAKGIGGMVNTEWDEECVSSNADGSQTFLFFDNAQYFADIGFATLKGKMWQKPEIFGSELNSKAFEGGACISLDGNTIVFTSNRKEGSMGGSDLYLIKKENNGSWSNPVNLGANINTTYDEEAPALSLDGNELYFSSKGWNSMGGFDIFRSVFDRQSNTWGKPENIGFPINTTEDNSFISFTGDGRSMYMAAIRPEGYGQRDIYKVSFLNTSSRSIYTVINGNVISTNGGKVELTRVSLVDKENKTLLEIKPPYQTNHFVLIAKPGNYTIRAEGYHFEPLHEPIEISSDNTAVIEKNISVTLSK